MSVQEITTSKADKQETFLSRWSRVKREVAQGAVPPGTVAAAEPLALPSLESLAEQGLEADFSPFMQAQVEEGVRRLAIQQLFKQPVFNVMDGLDVYIDDYSVFEPIAASELAGLSHARSMLFPESPSETGTPVSENTPLTPVAVTAATEIEDKDTPA